MKPTEKDLEKALNNCRLYAAKRLYAIKKGHVGGNEVSGALQKALILSWQEILRFCGDVEIKANPLRVEVDLQSLPALREAERGNMDRCPECEAWDGQIHRHYCTKQPPSKEKS